VFVFCQMPGGWRMGLIHHPLHDRKMMPGGHVEPAESQAEAAVREVAEEAGLAARLVSPPAVPLPPGYRPRQVASPWWIVEYDVPPDNHLAQAHIHIDHLYVAVADASHVSRPAHPFSWHAAADLPGLRMFPDARVLAMSLFSVLTQDGPEDPFARLRRTTSARGSPATPRSRWPASEWPPYIGEDAPGS
jgi:8-oxo-dGTP pyrophosphatase MutT (NUDIX family)